MLSALDKNFKSRVVGLDIVRSFAILQVVYAHGKYLLPASVQQQYMRFCPEIDGVSVFFVLSGFLIGGILIRTIHTTDFQRSDLFNFWIRRWFRTIPNYVLILLVLLTVEIAKNGSSGNFNWKYLLFLQNFAWPHPHFFGEAWSLSVEEWFYLLFPLTCFAIHKITRNPTKTILIPAVVFLVLPVFFRFWNYQPDALHYDEEIRKVVIMRLDSLMYGILGALIAANYKLLWQKLKYVLLVPGVAYIVLRTAGYLKFPAWSQPLQFACESIAVLFTLPYFSQLKTSRIRVLDYSFIVISIISYSMYLVNYTLVQRNIFPALEKIFHPMSGKVALLVFWSLTIGLSLIIYLLYEKRITRLRDLPYFSRKSRNH